MPASTLARDAVSATDAETGRALLAALGNRDSLARPVQEVYSYLASWDGAYTPEAIGATVLEAWLAAHESITGFPPNPADSLDRALLPYSLRLARAELRDRHGDDPADWRWGRFHGGIRHPVLGQRQGAAARAYRLADVGDGGHPSALRPGPYEREGAAAVWSAWTRVDALVVAPPRRMRADVARPEDVQRLLTVLPRTASGASAGRALQLVPTRTPS